MEAKCVDDSMTTSIFALGVSEIFNYILNNLICLTIKHLKFVRSVFVK